MAKTAGLGARFALGCLLALGISAPAHAEGESAETVVATVNGTDITLGQMVAMRQNLPEQYQTLADDVLFKGILEQLIQQTALVDSRKGALSKLDAATIENQRRAYLAGVALQEVIAGAVTDATVQAAYDARFASAAPMTEYHAAHILVADEQTAKDLKAQIDGGADFAELARANSSDGSAAGGGDLGWFGPGMMVKPFEDAVVALQPGQVSDPVQTQFGYHIVKLIETREAAPPAIDEVRAELAAEIERTAVETYVTSLTDAATITRAEGIDPAAVRSETLFGG